MSAAADEGRQKSPEEIRVDIEQTREELGDTVEALAAKTDVKAQAKERIASLKDTAQTKKDEFASPAGRRHPIPRRGGTTHHLDGQEQTGPVHRDWRVRLRFARGLAASAAIDQVPRA